MASLTSLPNELLCQIFEDVHNASASSNNLFSITLVSRRFNSIAIDALYKAPRLLKPNATDHLAWHDRRIHQLPGLLKTVINRPDLANQIYQLELTVIYDRAPGFSWPELGATEQVGSSTIYHWPKLNEGRLAIRGFHLDSAIVQSVPNMREGWEHHVRAGFEPAIAGLLLALTVSLTHLTLNVFRALKPNDQPESNHLSPRPNFESEYPRPMDWFGRNVSFTTSAVRGLAHARSLRCSTSLVPWRMIETSTLKVLDIKLPRFNIPFPLRIHGDKQVASLTHLTIRADCDIMQDHERSEDWYLAKLANRLPALEVLRIVVDGWLDDLLSSAYEYVIAHVEAQRLERLVIDARGVKNISNFGGDRGAVIRPVTFPLLLMKFPRLRRVVGLLGTFGTGALLRGIEVIELDADELAM